MQLLNSIDITEIKQELMEKDIIIQKDQCSRSHFFLAVSPFKINKIDVILISLM